jgi:hypothetical protein
MSRIRKPSANKSGLVVGSRWTYNRFPAIAGILDCVLPEGYVHCVVIEGCGDFVWKSTIQDFLKSWTRVMPQSDLDRDVARHAQETRRIPLPGQQSFLKNS